METTIKRLVKLNDPIREKTVNTLQGKKSFFELSSNPGIKARVRYFNEVERKKGVEKVITDYGLLLNDNTEIIHISATVFNYFSPIEVIERKKRL